MRTPPTSLIKSITKIHPADPSLKITNKGHSTVNYVSKETASGKRNSYVMKWIMPLSAPYNEHQRPDETVPLPNSLAPLLNSNATNPKEAISYSDLIQKTNEWECHLNDTLDNDTLLYFLNNRLHYICHYLTNHFNSLTEIQYATLYEKYNNYLFDYYQKGKLPTEKLIKRLKRDGHTAIREAISAELYRLIADTDLTPKVRVITHQTHDDRIIVIGSISKTITHYQPAFERKNRAAMLRLHEITTQDPRQYAQLFVSAFVLAENDLHFGNFGINAANNIVKIDHDNCLYPCSGYSGYFEIKMPNTIYKLTGFDHLTTWDIDNLPIIYDFKAANFPCLLNGIVKLNNSLSTLLENSEFQKWKFFYFTKAILLVDDHISEIIEDHSIEEAYSDVDLELKQFIHYRIHQLKIALLNTSRYRDFLNNETAFLTEVLKIDCLQYNLETCDTVRKKQHKAHRAINFQSCITKLSQLQCDSQLKQVEVNNNPQIEKIFRFTELVDRYKRESNAITQIEKIECPREKISTTLLEELLATILKDAGLLLENTQGALGAFLTNIPEQKLLDPEYTDVLLFVFLKLFKLEGFKALCDSYPNFLTNIKIVRETHKKMMWYWNDNSSIKLITFLFENKKINYLYFFLDHHLRHYLEYHDEQLQYIPDICSFVLNHKEFIALSDKALNVIRTNNAKLRVFFDSFQSRYPNNICSKLHESIKSINQFLSIGLQEFPLSFASLGFLLFNQQSSIQQRQAVTKCLDLFYKKEVEFSQQDLLHTKELIDSKTTFVPLKGTLRFLFRSIEKMPTINKGETISMKLTLVKPNESEPTRIQISFPARQKLSPPVATHTGFHA